MEFGMGFYRQAFGIPPQDSHRLSVQMAMTTCFLNNCTCTTSIDLHVDMSRGVCSGRHLQVLAAPAPRPQHWRVELGAPPVSTRPQPHARKATGVARLFFALLSAVLLPSLADGSPWRGLPAHLQTPARGSRSSSG
jgi:hypothetical protein